MRVGVVGAGGRMGQEVCRAIVAHPELVLAAAVDPGHVGVPVRELIGNSEAEGPVVSGALEEIVAAGCEVVVDFTHLEVSRATLAFCAGAGIHAVVGTTGFVEADLDELARVFAPEVGHGANCVIAANFAIGAVLMMRFAALAAPWFDGAEIIELHHEGKRDAPSGTSLRTAEAMAASRGGAGPGGVRMHAVRLPGLVAHQEVLFGAPGQGLTIRHDSYDRASFMDGVVLAVEQVPIRPGLTVGLEALLGI